MNNYYRQIVEQINQTARKNPQPSKHFNLSKYMGTTHTIVNITTSQLREIIKNWTRENKDIAVGELIDVLDSFYVSNSHTDRSVGGKMLEYLPKQRQQIPPEHIDKWLTGARGWEEVDSLCQNSFTAHEVFENWKEWEKLLKKFVSDKDVHKRRASLVLLVRPVRESGDYRLTKMSFGNIEKLKAEKDILITKAISWLLRELIVYHKQEVVECLDKNGSTLPKIAVRETKRKLTTGKK